jgi:hypothetical protein
MPLKSRVKSSHEGQGWYAEEPRPLKGRECIDAQGIRVAIEQEFVEWSDEDDEATTTARIIRIMHLAQKLRQALREERWWQGIVEKSR